MKLVEIKDVRPGQIRKVTAYNQWKDEKEFEVLAVIEAAGIGEYAEFNNYAELYDIQTKQLIEDDSEELHFYEDGELIGQLYVINREIDFGIKETHPDNSCFEATNDLYGSRQLVDFELKRVGILGVTHEFVNNREAEFNGVKLE